MAVEGVFTLLRGYIRQLDVLLELAEAEAVAAPARCPEVEVRVRDGRDVRCGEADRADEFWNGKWAKVRSVLVSNIR